MTDSKRRWTNPPGKSDDWFTERYTHKMYGIPRQKRGVLCRLAKVL